MECSMQHASRYAEAMAKIIVTCMCCYIDVSVIKEYLSCNMYETMLCMFGGHV